MLGADYPPEWRVSHAPVAYPDAVHEMEQRVALIEAGTAPELIWLLEHPPLYTAGTSADDAELLDAHGLPVYKTGRGGKHTWHGPGQRIVYVLRDLRKQDRDVRQHVCTLEQWMIDVLKDFGIKGERREGRIGIWVVKDKGDAENKNIPPPSREGEVNHSSLIEEKIGAIGVRVRHWVTYHGLALNVNPDLEAFNGIVPCGLPDFGVTSLQAVGVKATMADVDEAFRRNADGLGFLSC